MNIFSHKYRRLSLFMLPVVITLCGLLVVSYANRGSGNDHGPNKRGKLFLQNQASSSDLVVLGRVASVRTGKEDNTIFTYATIEPVETISGQAESPIVVRQIGGSVGNTTALIGSTMLPNWKESEEVLLFLMRLEKSNYYIAGASGQFTAQKNADGQDVFVINPNIRNSDLPRETIPDRAYSRMEVLEYVRSLKN